jgi:type IV fimbrial biogenesis protein FimT
MRDRRTVAAAQQVATLYRNARLRALGRGAAVMVRFATKNGAGGLTALEAIAGVKNACLNMPKPTCPVDWNDTNSRESGQFIPANTAGFQPIQLNVTDYANAAQTAMDICFTPLGHTYIRFNAASAWVTMTNVPTVEVWRDDGTGAAMGLRREVLIPPNGAARLGTAK